MQQIINSVFGQRQTFCLEGSEIHLCHSGSCPGRSGGSYRTPGKHGFRPKYSATLEYGVRDRFWRRRHTENILVILQALLADILVLISFLTLVILRIPGSVILTGLLSIVIPVWMGLKTLHDLKNDTPIVSTANPSEFIAKFKSIRQMIRSVQAVALVIIVVSFASQYTPVLGFFSGFSQWLGSLGIYTGLIYFFFIELTVLCTVLGFWAPKPIFLLRATLLSQFSDNGVNRSAWLDDSIGHFNRLLASEGNTVKKGSSLDALLFTSPRLLSVTRLIWALETPDHTNFVREVSSIARLPVAQLVDRITLSKIIEENLPLIRNALSLLIPAAPYLAPFLLVFMNQTLDNWANLLKLLH